MFSFWGELLHKAAYILKIQAYLSTKFIALVLFRSRNLAQLPCWGQIRRIGWVIKTLEAKVGQFLLGCKCPVSRGIVVQETDLLGDLPAAFFLQNVLQLHQQRSVILRVDSLALWKIINKEDAVLIPPPKKKTRRELFQRIFALGNFLGAG